jgi:hypothetical protein
VGSHQPLEVIVAISFSVFLPAAFDTSIHEAFQDPERVWVAFSSHTV